MVRSTIRARMTFSLPERLNKRPRDHLVGRQLAHNPAEGPHLVARGPAATQIVLVTHTSDSHSVGCCHSHCRSPAFHRESILTSGASRKVLSCRTIVEMLRSQIKAHFACERMGPIACSVSTFGLTDDIRSNHDYRTSANMSFNSMLLNIDAVKQPRDRVRKIKECLSSHMLPSGLCLSTSRQSSLTRGCTSMAAAEAAYSSDR